MRGLRTRRSSTTCARIGVTAVELLPVHQFVAEQALTGRGLTNYWGYNTIGFLAPHNHYCSAGQRGEQVGEFKTMVKAMHSAGIEVILDVVYNHTAEGDGRGPTLSFRGIDNAAYYRLDDRERWRYLDYTGCGNSLNVRHPHSLQLIMDSLRYWILEMHVDGFRFDLASALAREFYDVDRLSTFFDLVQQDPVVSQVKLIAEPWDVGIGGYQVGNFPPLWTEWNGKYRDTVRDFWRGRPATLPEFASRLTGSSDLYETSGRRPVASINFVTCHDGFTARRPGVLQRQAQRGQRRGQPRRDRRQPVLELRGRGPGGGPGDQPSCGPGSSGTSWSPCSARRASPCCWPATRSAAPRAATTTPTARTTRSPGWTGPARRASVTCWPSPSGWRSCGDAIRCSAGAGSSSPGDIQWLTPTAQEMTDSDWQAGYAKSVAVLLDGSAISEPDPRGDPVTDNKFLMLFNAGTEPITFTLPEVKAGCEWEIVIDTTSARGISASAEQLPKAKVEVAGRAVTVLMSGS